MIWGGVSRGIEMKTILKIIILLVRDLIIRFYFQSHAIGQYGVI